jgi:hypothetical protein
MNRERSHITEIFYQKSSDYTSFSFMGSYCHPPCFWSPGVLNMFFIFIVKRAYIIEFVWRMLIQNHVWELFTKPEHISGLYMYSMYTGKQ